MRSSGGLSFRICERLVYDAPKIGRDFYIPTCHRADAVTPKPPYKIAKLQHYILPGSRFQSFTLLAALVVRCEKDDGEANFAVRFNFLNDGTTLACLLVEDDRLKFNLFKKACDCFTRAVVVSMDDEYLA